MRAVSVFPAYTKVKSPLPRAVWDVLRAMTLAFTVGVAGALILWPAVGLKLFWSIVVPALPAIIVVAPGLWREICPMAYLNQMPRRAARSLNLSLGPRLSALAYPFAVIAFLGLVALRKPWLNGDGAATGAMVLAALGLALAGGYVFKGRSGWCGTFCPLGPIQRDYGQAPTLNIPNTHCTTCVSCQTNCFDFNPKAALFDDIHDADESRSNQHLFFIGMMPGVIWGYFSQLDATYPYSQYLAIYVGSLLASSGLFFALAGFARLGRVRAAGLFGAVAVAEFYVFAAPIVAKGSAALLGGAPSDLATLVIRGVGIAAALLLYGQNRRNAATFERAEAAERLAKAAAAAESGVYEVVEKSSGAVLRAPLEETLLETFRAGGVEIEASCQYGLCGSDLITILEGADNLSPPGEDELATLRRLGADGRGRLACQCRVRGPVVIDRRPPVAEPEEDVEEEPALADAGDIEARMRLAVRRPRSGRRNLVIVGNGVAGSSVAEALLQEKSRWRLTLLAHEGAPFYNRMALAKIVNGSASPDDLTMPGTAAFAGGDVTQILDRRVVAIDRVNRVVTNIRGERIGYDALVLATGASARAPTPEFLAYDNAFVLRTRADAAAIRAVIELAGARRAVVLGGGVLGVEAAEALREAGLGVALIHSRPHLMDRNLAPDGSELLERYLARIGVSLHMGAPVARFAAGQRLTAAELIDGSVVPGDLFVACIGQTPNVELARACGLSVKTGICVDSFMRTSDPNIFAIGDVAEFGCAPVGLWSTAAQQAKTVASALMGRIEPYAAAPQMLRLKSAGLDLFAFGDIAATPEGAEVINSGLFESGWWRMVLVDGAVVAANFIGRKGAANPIERLLRSTFDISGELDRLRESHGPHPKIRRSA